MRRSVRCESEAKYPCPQALRSAFFTYQGAWRQGYHVSTNAMHTVRSRVLLMAIFYSSVVHNDTVVHNDAVKQLSGRSMSRILAQTHLP